MSKLIVFMFLFCIFMISAAYAATIQGTVYDLSLEPVENSIIEIDSTPLQRFVAKDGTYSFTLSKGSYAITATADGNRATENVKIIDEGIYNIDLFLFPALDEDLAIDLDIDTGYGKPNYLPYIYILLAIIVLTSIAIGLYRFRHKPSTEAKKEWPNKETGDAILDEKDKILGIIKKHGNRTTQKDIRKEILLSEAKVSLILAELEHENKIKKMKKGRGNIIILTSEK